MAAIRIAEDGLSDIDEEICVECQACFKGLTRMKYPQQPTRFLKGVLAWFKLRFQPDPDICPTSAITQDELTWPRSVRRVFSDPQMPHESTGVGGRGTMEVKTNDVTGRVKEGEVGFAVEFGRPGVGAYFRDVDKVTQAVVQNSTSVELQPKNPVTSLMSDMKTGKIREDVLDEKVMSCILEFKMKEEDMPEMLRTIEREVKKIDTVVSLGIAVRCDSEGYDTVRSKLKEMGFDAWRAKINMGLGRHTNPTPAKEEANA
jgi:hypothetical protein